MSSPQSGTNLTPSGRVALPPRGWRRVSAWLERMAKESERGYLIAMSCLVGIAMGVIATGFRWLIVSSHEFVMGAHTSPMETRKLVLGGEVVLRALLPALGGLIVGFIIYKLLQLRGGHGVPSVMKAVATGNVNLHPSMAYKSLSVPITISSGGSTGTEGPIVEIGSVVGSIIGSWGHAAKEQVGTLVGCGAAAGISAIFGAPMGGVIFALELIMRDFHVRKFAPIVVASAVASVTSNALRPHQHALEPLKDSIFNSIEPNAVLITQFALVGAACGVMGWLFVTLLYWMHDRFGALKIPMWTKPAIGGLFLGIIGLKVPGVLGEGYQTINDVVLKASHPTALGSLLGTLALLAILKLVASSLTLGSGGTGGTFAPSMVAGGFLGAAMGLIFKEAMPTFSPDYRIFALVGMAGVVASALGTPLAALFIIYEVSGGSYKLVLPLMIAVAISSLVSSRLRKGSVYTLSLLRDGFDVEEAFAQKRDPLADTPVRSVMESRFVSLHPADALPKILELLSATDEEAFVVINDEGELRGIISTNDLRSIINLGSLADAAFIAGDIAESNPPVLTPDSPSSRAMEIFGASDIEGIPVVVAADDRTVIGMVYRGPVLRAYRRLAGKKESAD